MLVQRVAIREREEAIMQREVGASNCLREFWRKVVYKNA